MRPSEVHHISQIRPKIVRIIDDAPERYLHDEKWVNLDEPDKHFGIRCLEASRGQDCMVITAQRRGNEIWYELFFDPPLEVENILGSKQSFRFLHVSADYVQVINSGFLEAR
jgi:hypothetical protein